MNRSPSSFRSSHRRFSLPVLLLAAVVVPCLQAANIVVNSVGDPAGFNPGVTPATLGPTVTLRDAINAANNAQGDHTIEFAPALAGRGIELSQVGDSTFGRTAFKIKAGTTITLRSSSADGAGVTLTRTAEAIQGGLLFFFNLAATESELRFFYVEAGASLNLVNMTLAYGVAKGADSPNNQKTPPAAGLPNKESSDIWNGGAGAGLGGAVVNAGTLVLDGSLLVGNQATGGSGRSFKPWQSAYNPGETSIFEAWDRSTRWGLPLEFLGRGFAGNEAQVWNPAAQQAGNLPDLGSHGKFGWGGYSGAISNLTNTVQQRNAGSSTASFVWFTPGSGPGLNGGFGGGGGGSMSDAGDGGFGGGGGSAPGRTGRGGFGGANADATHSGGGAGLGGAIFNYGGTLRAVNSTFTQNQASGRSVDDAPKGSALGGAIFNLNGVTELTFCTVVGNIADQGGAIYSLGDNGVATQQGPALPSNRATVRLWNSILGLSGDLTPDFVQATHASDGVRQGSVLSEGDRNTTQQRANGAAAFQGQALLAVAAVGPLTTNGGPTRTLMPFAGSAIGGTTSDLRGVGTDQRGVARRSPSVFGSVDQTMASAFRRSLIRSVRDPQFDVAVAARLSPAGGTLVGTGVSDGTKFSPSIGIGDYTLTYFIDAARSPALAATVVISVRDIALTFADQREESAIEFILSSADSAVPLEVYTRVPVEGGYFYGPGVTNGLFVPYQAGIGTHQIQYYRSGTGAERPEFGVFNISVRDIAPTQPLPANTRTDDGPRAFRMSVHTPNFELNPAVFSPFSFLTEIFSGIPVFNYLGGSSGVVGNTFSAVATEPGVYGISRTGYNMFEIQKPEVIVGNLFGEPSGGGLLEGLSPGRLMGGIFPGGMLDSLFPGGNMLNSMLSAGGLEGILPPGDLGSIFPTDGLAGISPIDQIFAGLNGLFPTGLTGPVIPMYQERIRMSVIPYPPAYLSPKARNYTVQLDAAPISLAGISSAQPAGGVFSGPGVSDDDRFDPSAAGVGDHTITYSVDVGTPAVRSTAFTVHVVAGDTWISIPERTIVRSVGSPAESLSTLLAVYPGGGLFEGNGVSGGVFTPANAGVGVHQIKYTSPPDPLGSSHSVTFTIVVTHDAPAAAGGVEVATSELQCGVSDPAFDIQDATRPSIGGGQFVGPGLMTGGQFSPAHAGLGRHRLLYRLPGTADRGLRSVAVYISVLDKPPVSTSFTGLESTGDRSYRISTDSPDVTLPGFGPLNLFSIYGGPGITEEGKFSPVKAGIGTHSLYNFITHTEITVQVIPPPPIHVSAAFADLTFSVGHPVLILSDLGALMPAGGNFSGPGVSGGRFNPALAGVGSHVITYRIATGRAGLSRSATFRIRVVNTPVILGANSLLISAAAPAVDLATYTSASPPGGRFSGPGLTGGMFNPAMAGVGTHRLRYSILNDQSIAGWADFSIRVQLIAGRSESYGMTIVNPPVSLPDFTGMRPLGGVYTGPGVSGNTFTAADAGIGTHNVTYAVQVAAPSGGFVSESVTFQIEVTSHNLILGQSRNFELPYDAPAASLSQLTGLRTITGRLVVTGDFAGPGVSGDLFSAAAAGFGTHTLSFNAHTTLPSGEVVSDSMTFQINVTELPPVQITFSKPNPHVILGYTIHTLFDVTGVSPSGGTFSGPQVLQDYLTTQTPGIYRVRYTVPSPGRREPVSAEVDVAVLAEMAVTTDVDEFQPPFLEEGAGVSLQEAVFFATTRGGNQTIRFADHMAGKTIVLGKLREIAPGRTAIRIPSGIHLTIKGLPGKRGITIAGIDSILSDEQRATHPGLRLFYVEPGATLTLEDLTVTGGFAKGQSAVAGGGGAGLGGAIFNAGTVNLNRVLLVANRATGGSVQADGVAIYNPYSGDAIPPLVTFAPASIAGGGLSPSILNWSTTADRPGSAAFGEGGAFYVNGANTSYWPTSGGFGGGGSMGGDGGFGGGAGARFQNILFLPSGAAGPAGTPGYGGGAADTSGMTNAYVGSLVGGAGAGMGGAIFNYGGTLNITNSTFTANEAVGGGAPSTAARGSGRGGAIFNLNGVVNATYTTIAANTASHGGGGIFSLANYTVATQSGPALRRDAATVYLQNSILSDSIGSVDYFQQQASPAVATSSGDHNIIESQGADNAGFGGSYVGNDPQLMPLADRGGPTRTMGIPATSPAFQAATPVAGVTVDQRGHERSSTNPDIGATKISYPPILSLATANSISTVSAILGGSATQGGTPSITHRGFVVSLTATNTNPRLDGPGVTLIEAGSGAGSFTAQATLAHSSAYSFAAFATADGVTVYSSTATFQTLELDSDGDTLSDAQERGIGTDPFSIDTDGDGYNDATELLAGSDPKLATSIPPSPHIERVLGFGAARGLDFTGNFIYAVNLGTTRAAGRVGDAVFTTPGIPGVSINAGTYATDWTSRDFGNSTDANNLETVFASDLWIDTFDSNPSRRTLRVDLANLVPGRAYKLQLLFAEHGYGTRTFDVYAGGTRIAGDFKTGDAQGGAYSTKAASAIVHEFFATNTVLNIVLDGSTVTTFPDIHQNPILSGFTLEESVIGDDDPDGDTLTNLQERNLGTDPFSIDTDGDGYNDATEVLAGTSPTIQHHVPRAPHYERVLGFGAGWGLDLSGNFLYAVNVGSYGAAGRAGDANFTSPRVPGVTISAANEAPAFTTRRFNDVPDARTLETVFASHLWADASDADPSRRALRVTLGGLVPGRRYKLQLLFAENGYGTRTFDVFVEGALVADDFKSADVQGGDHSTRTAAAIVHEFSATRSEVNIVLDSSSVVTFPDIHLNPFLSGFTLEEQALGDDDADGDTITNLRERDLGTDPFSIDTDGDGYNDATELLAGSDPKSAASVPPSTHIERVLGFGPAKGLDLTGNFLYSVNLGTAQSAGRVENAVFKAGDVPGVTISPGYNATGFTHRNFGVNAFADNLGAVFASNLYVETFDNDPSRRSLRVDLANLVPGQRYKLQLLFAEHGYGTRTFNVQVGSNRIAGEFKTAVAQGSSYSTNAASAIVHEFIATGTVLNIVLDGATVTPFANAHLNPILSGFTLKALPTPAPVAVADSIHRPGTTRVTKVLIADLLANDSNPNGNAFTITGVTNALPAGSTVTLSGNFVVYTAPATNSGNGSFTYTISNGPHTDSAGVTVVELASTTEPPVPDSPPNVAGFSLTGTDVNLAFFGVPGRTYGIQYTTSLTSPYVWNEMVPQADIVAPPSGVMRFTDQAPAGVSRFYRAVLRRRN